jgi:multidrug efflux pump subunit AcrA (membrane-fusion protein)
MSMSEGRIVVLATLPMLVGAVWLLGLRRPEPVAQAPMRSDANAARERSQVDAVAEGEGYLGVIIAGSTADVAAEIPGSVAEVGPNVGARVKAGELLLRVDPGSAGEDVRAARARLEQQHSAVARAQAELSEASDLVARMSAMASGVSERTAVAGRAREQQAKAALQEALAGVGVQEAEVDQRLSISKKNIIRAPFDGILVARFVDAGGSVVPGQVVVRVMTDSYFVRFAMPPDEARKKQVGFEVEVELPGVARRLAGKVTDIQPEVDSVAQMVFARAGLGLHDAAVGAVIPGVRVRVRPVASAIAPDTNAPREN